MKKVLITLAILNAVIGTTKAQVTKTGFGNNIGALKNAIDAKNLSLQNSELALLIGQMNSEIQYLQQTNNVKGKNNGVISIDQQMLAEVKAVPTKNIIVTVKEVELIKNLKIFYNTLK